MHRIRSWSLRAVSLGLLTFGVLHCGPHNATTTADGDDEGEGDSEAIGTSQQRVMALPARCYGKMLKPTPLDLEQPIGQPMTIRINRTCMAGAPLVARKIKVVIRRYELNGTVGPQVTLVDWSDWPGTQYRFEAPWTGGATLSAGTLTPGRYQMYSYTINASLMDAWTAGDPFARNMSTRSDNTYVVLKDPGTWTSSSFSTCSATCGTGTQTRTNSCVDGSGNALESRFCLSSEPSTSQACTGTCSGLYTSTGWMGDRKIHRVTPAGVATEIGSSTDGSSVVGAANGSLLRLSTSKIELVDPTTLQTTSTITLSQTIGEPGGIVATGSGYLITEPWGSLRSVSPTGTVTSLGNFGVRSKALAWDPVSSSLYTCAVHDGTLRKISTTNGSTVSSVTMTSSYGTINGCFGLAWAGSTAYGLFRFGGDWRRRLGSIDFTTGVVTDIGAMPNYVRGLSAL